MKFSTLFGICSNFPIRNGEKVRTLKATRNKRLLLALYAFGLMTRSNSRGGNSPKTYKGKWPFFDHSDVSCKFFRREICLLFPNPQMYSGFSSVMGAGGNRALVSRVGSPAQLISISEYPLSLPGCIAFLDNLLQPFSYYYDHFQIFFDFVLLAFCGKQANVPQE